MCNILWLLSVNGIHRCSSRVMNGRSVCVCLHERAEHRASWLSKCSSALHQHITMFICPVLVTHAAPQTSPSAIDHLQNPGSAISFLTAGKGSFVCCIERNEKKPNFGDRKSKKKRGKKAKADRTIPRQRNCSLSQPIWTTYASIFTCQTHLLQH